MAKGSGWEAELREHHQDPKNYCVQHAIAEGAKWGAVGFGSSVALVLGLQAYSPYWKKVGPSGKAFIVAAATTAGFFVAGENTLLECNRANRMTKR